MDKDTVLTEEDFKSRSIISSGGVDKLLAQYAHDYVQFSNYGKTTVDPRVYIKNRTVTQSEQEDSFNGMSFTISVMGAPLIKGTVMGYAVDLVSDLSITIRDIPSFMTEWDREVYIRAVEHGLKEFEVRLLAKAAEHGGKVKVGGVKIDGENWYNSSLNRVEVSLAAFDEVPPKVVRRYLNMDEGEWIHMTVDGRSNAIKRALLCEIEEEQLRQEKEEMRQLDEANKRNKELKEENRLLRKKNNELEKMVAGLKDAVARLAATKTDM